MKKHGVQPIRLDVQPSTARGVGGTATPIGVWSLPIGIAHTAGVLTCTVLAENLPLLLPISFLKSLGMILNLEKMTCYWTKLKAASQLRVEPSGHIGITVLDYPRKGWHPPPMNFMQHHPENKHNNEVYIHATVVADVSATSKDVVSHHVGSERGKADSEAQSGETWNRRQCL
eukprot:6491144-Amphidinium_carterae.3